MPEITKEGELQVKALIEAVSPSIVYLLNRDPNGNQSVGTGFITMFRGRRYFASALHNFDFETGDLAQTINTWNGTRFKFRDSNSLSYEESINIPFSRLKTRYGNRAAVSP